MVWDSIPRLVILGPSKKPNQILDASDADRSRIRKQFLHSFSEKALTEQEPSTQSYVDLLIDLLQKDVGLSERLCSQ